MPRTRRQKSEDAIYHVMIRSITEVPLFEKHEDKIRYLNKMREYQKQYGFKVYAYCLMTNHGHFIIDSNGADISKIMHGLNFSYAINFNKINKRRGPLFQDRFKSKIVDTQRYLITLSAYIHNNVLDITGYEKCPEKYKYSSLKVYLGLEKDATGLLDEAFIMQYFSNNVKEARENYAKLVYICDDEKIKNELEFQDEETEYRSDRTIIVRDFEPDEILKFIEKETGIDKIMCHVKNNKNSKIVKALASLLMRSLCNYRCKDICKVLGNIAQSTVSRLCSIGVELISTEDKYKNIINKFISEHRDSKALACT
ncbi:transposase IS200-family protein [Clostridium cochlearium]|uniref:Transposase IS200-family protein n=2 Tax=Clostridium cochlearium TaxID=1494 RepID=A0A240AE93_CLOCO|nr:transposase IS200-family protein [Clostridium cochlearium]SQB33524.1 transposase IS200-family protein [Clostridium cochlearium]SQB35716.1 transposase IS200-family protein [Clostridium cochlearium]STA92909.1 transposase IS200-family protein [Clostridium cochlearium]